MLSFVRLAGAYPSNAGSSSRATVSCTASER
jgi:hypothetical protein